MNPISQSEPLREARERVAVQLSKNLFAEITGISLEEYANFELKNDRRAHPRVAFDHRARIFPLMEGVGEGGSAILVRDISVGGIGFLYAEPIGVGDEFVIRIFTTAGQPIDIQCAARHCELGGTCGSQYAVGATFELVLNRPLSAAVAPETEMALDQEPLVDQPAPPTIEQRYDQQCVTSRLIRPIIRETRWGSWVARPAISKIIRILMRILWPAIAVWRAINSVIQAGEESRIRHRLTPSKSGKKWRMKKRSASVAQLPVQEMMLPTLESATTTDAPATGTNYASFFQPTEAAKAAAPVSPIQTNARPSSIFKADETESIPTAPAAPTISAPLPITTPVAAVVSVEPIAPATPAPGNETIAAPVASPVLTETAACPVPASVPAPAVSTGTETSNVTTPAASENAEIAPLPISVSQPTTIEIDQTRSTPPSANARPPVAHPRQIRRRARPAFRR